MDIEFKFKKGWVAMDQDGTWKWFAKKPVIDNVLGMWCTDIRRKCEKDPYPQKMIFIEVTADEKNWKKTVRRV